jgi:hypothetical protein
VKTIAQEMLLAARLGAAALCVAGVSPARAEAVSASPSDKPVREPPSIHDTIRFIQAQWTDEGGFRGRGREGDLYFTVFGIQCLLAMDGELPAQLRAYLESFGDGGDLDLVHACCLARCWAYLDGRAPGAVRDGLLAKVRGHRSADGGYSATGGAHGSAYGCFLAVGAHQDLGVELPDSQAVTACIESLRTPGGAYANEKSIPLATTPSTAAAITVLRHLGLPAPDSAAQYLLGRFVSTGGFAAFAGAPGADLLSTATALHALDALAASPEPDLFATVRQPCLEFLQRLQAPQGGFAGTPDDTAADCEYTFYGLLAMGTLRSGAFHDQM